MSRTGDVGGAQRGGGGAGRAPAAPCPDVRCDGIAGQGISGKFSFRYALTGDESQVQKAIKGFGEARQSASQANKLDKTGGVALSDDPLAIMGIAFRMKAPNNRQEAARSLDRSLSTLFDPGHVARLGMRMHTM